MPEQEAPRQNPRHSLPEARVLIVDDSKIIRQRLLALMNPMPRVTVVGQAAGIQEAMSLIDSESPNVLTLDINLQDESGLDLLREVKALPDPPVTIVLTNYPYPAFRERATLLGAEHFLTKSKDFHHIESILCALTAAGALADQ